MISVKGMPGGLAGNEEWILVMRYQVLVLRIVIGLIAAVLLTRFFFPTAGVGTMLLIAGMLIFFAYVLESVHSRRR